MLSIFQIINPVLPPTIGSGGNAAGPIAFGKIIGAAIAAMYVIGFMTAMIFLITGGFYWITSAGDKANLESARNRITHAIIGLIVLFSSYAVLMLLATFIGWEEFPKLPLPTINQAGSNTGGGGGNYGPGGCSYAPNGGYACYTWDKCVQCVNGTTNWNADPGNCPAPCGR